MNILFRIAILIALMLPQAALAQNSVVTLDPPSPDAAVTEPAEAQPAAPPPPCGTQQIAIARMSWPSAALLAEIHSRLLTSNYFCNVAVQDSDLAATGSAMGATGQPAVAPELWVGRIAEIWNAAIKGQKVRQAGTTYVEPGFEGWYVPDYVVAQWPEATTIDGLKARAADFGGGAARGRFISCPVDWGCAVVNRNMLRAYGLDQTFDIVEPANRFELDTLIAEAVGRQEPILFYYWRPNAVLSQFGFTEVQLAAYDAEAFACMGRLSCGAPRPTGYAPDQVVIALAEWVYLDAPQIASYFSRARMPFAEMNLLLQQLSEPEATIESVADRFVEERGEIWRPWVGLPVEVEASEPAAQ
ncbi:MAG: glycine betaine ABC transporter substrate-binding protein [Devosia sp.]